MKGKNMLRVVKALDIMPRWCVVGTPAFSVDGDYVVCENT